MSPGKRRATFEDSDGNQLAVTSYDYDWAIVSASRDGRYRHPRERAADRPRATGGRRPDPGGDPMTPRKSNPVPLGGFVGIVAIIVTAVLVAAKIPADGWAHSWPWLLVLAPVLVVYGLTLTLAIVALALGVYAADRADRAASQEVPRFEIVEHARGVDLRDYASGIEYPFASRESAETARRWIEDDSSGVALLHGVPIGTLAREEVAA